MASKGRRQWLYFLYMYKLCRSVDLIMVKRCASTVSTGCERQTSAVSSAQDCCFSQHSRAPQGHVLGIPTRAQHCPLCRRRRRLSDALQPLLLCHDVWFLFLPRAVCLVFRPPGTDNKPANRACATRDSFSFSFRFLHCHFSVV